MKNCCKEVFEPDMPSKAKMPGKKHAFERLRQKWEVRNAWQVILILCTFAIGGSLAGYGGRKILGALEAGWLRAVLYIPLVSLLWPFCVIVTGALLGQRKFFIGFVGRLLKRIGIRKRTSAQDHG